MRITLILLLILCLLWAWCLPGNEVETVSMYMYNGVKLPALPEFEYEYAYIAENVAIKGWYALFVSDKAFVYDKLTNTMIRQDGSTVMRCVCTGEAWGEFVAHESDSLLAPIWANYDVLDTNGDVRLYATEPAKMWENARSFLIGLAMAFAGKPLPISQGEKEPVAYLYNGKNMGELPEWDVSKFPYACIERSKVSKTSYKLYLMKSKVYGVVQSDGDVNLYGNISYLSYSGGIGQHWHSFHDNTSASGSFLVATDPAYAVWANHDIIADDGSMILPASDPVPVYE